MLNRDIMDWEWYTDLNTCKVFQHCLLKVNYSGKKWQGIVINKGEFITSYEKFAIETGLSVSKVRTALSKLVTTEYVSIKTTNSYTKISVLKMKDFLSESNQNQFDTVKNLSNSLPLEDESETNVKRLANESQTYDKGLANGSLTADNQLATTNTNNKNIKIRKKIFRETVFSHSNFNSNILESFFLHWSEEETNGLKMRFESQKYFEVENRLKKWQANERTTKYNHKTEPEFQTNR